MFVGQCKHALLNFTNNDIRRVFVLTSVLVGDVSLRPQVDILHEHLGYDMQPSMQ